jgi:excisionase family DNA binding protein
MQQARTRLLEDSLTREQAAELLGVRSQQVSKLLAARDLVALEVGRELRLPRWQFAPDTPKGRLEGIREVVNAYAGGVVTLSLWATRPNPALGRRTPSKALAEGDVEAVVAAATAGV